MRVLHVSAYFAPAFGFGGPPRSILALCQAQQAAGLDVEVFTTTANPGCELPACPVAERVEGVPARYFPLAPPRWMLGAPSMHAPLAAAIEQADVLHLHGLFNRTAWIAGAVAARSTRPLVVSPRGMLTRAALDHHRWRKRASWWLFERRLARIAAAWHATSTDEARSIAAYRLPGRVVTVPNPVPLIRASAEAVTRARTRAGVPAGVPYVLFLGRLHPIKRLDLLAEAFARVAAAHPSAHLVLAGPDELGYRARIEGRFAPLGVRVHWTGAVEEGVRGGLLAGASALVLCSDAESFGMSVAEALSAAVPVIVTETCGWPDVARARSGWRVPQQPGAIAAAIDEALADPSGAADRGARGRLLMTREYSADAIGRRWLEVYAALAARRAA